MVMQPWVNIYKNTSVVVFSVAEKQRPCVSLQVVEQGMFVKHCKVEVYLTELKLCEDSNMENVVTRRFSKADTIGMMPIQITAFPHLVLYVT